MVLLRPEPAPEPHTGLFRAYAFALALAGLLLTVVSLPHIRWLEPRYWALLVPGTVGAALTIPLFRGARTSLHMPAALAAVWLFGWQAAPLLHLPASLVFSRLYRLDRWQAAVFFGSAALGTTLAGILPRGPATLPVTGAVGCALAAALAVGGHRLDRQPLDPRHVAGALLVLLMTALPLSSLMARAALASPAAYALSLATPMAVGLALLRLAERRRRRPPLPETEPSTDPLTGLPDRARFLEVFAEELTRHEREGNPLSLLLLDVRGPKGTGEPREFRPGDERLRQAAASLRARLRATDAVFRFGGDAFAILLPNTDLDGAVTVARALSALLGASGIATAIGVAVFPQHGTRSEDLLATAERALYMARRSETGVAVAPIRSLKGSRTG